MVEVKREGILLEATELEFENQAVLNPSIVQEGEILHMFYRAVREGNYSTLGYCKLKGPMNVVERREEPVLYPEYEYEKHGVEDPRIVFLDGLYYLIYTAYDGKNARVAYASSKDLKKWDKHGLITPSIKYDEVKTYLVQSKLKNKYYQFISYLKDITAPDVLLWEKDCILLPKKIGNRYALIHRILPDIQVIFFDNFAQLEDQDYWKEYLKNLSQYVIMEPKFAFENHIGSGAPLIETDYGWLSIYHAVEDTNAGQIYHSGAALLEKTHPFKVIGRLKKPLFSPTEDYEIFGDVGNVVFPTGTALFNEILYIYYGAADKRIAVVSVKLKRLIKALIKSQSRLKIDIGFLAGEIFKRAYDKEISLEKLKSEYKDKEDLLMMALGWLARENKLIFGNKDGTIMLWTTE